MPAPRIGFRFVPMPIEIWDGNHNDLTVAEFRLYGYLIRHQIRLGRPVLAIDHDELFNGVWGPPGDRGRLRLDQGCGLARNGIKRALASLEKRGWIEVNDVSSNPKRPHLAVRVIFDDPLSTVDNKVSSVDNQLSTMDNNHCPPWTTPSNTVDSKKKKAVEETGEPPARPSDPETIIRQSIFPYYIETVRPGSAGIYTLTPERLRKGVLRFQECLEKCRGDTEKAEGLMKIAIDTLARSDFHMGFNPKTEGKKYNDWDNLFRNAEMLEKWFVQSGDDAYAESQGSLYR